VDSEPPVLPVMPGGPVRGWASGSRAGTVRGTGRFSIPTSGDGGRCPAARAVLISQMLFFFPTARKPGAPPARGLFAARSTRWDGSPVKDRPARWRPGPGGRATWLAMCRRAMHGFQSRWQGFDALFHHLHQPTVNGPGQVRQQ